MKKKERELLIAIDKAEAADAGVNAAKEAFHAYIRIEAETSKERIRKAETGEGDFTVYELTFAATARCSCGAGFAYPEEIGMHGAWYCSAILMGEAQKGTAHSASLPFAFYEIKSEGQASAQGATTRPAGTHLKFEQSYVCRKCQHSGIINGRGHDFACENCGAKRINADHSLTSDLIVRRFESVLADEK